MKRLLFETHRWLGIVLALFMFTWFASGLVIMYAGHSATDRGEQLAHAQSLATESGWLSLGNAWQRSAVQRANATQGGGEGKGSKGGEALAEARLVRTDGRPFWLADDVGGHRYAIAAHDGQLHTFTPEEATRIAIVWANTSAATPLAAERFQYIDSGKQDSAVRNYQGLRPFHRIAVADANGRELLVSARSGEVVRDSTRFDRIVFWAGNWLHLLRGIEDFGGTGDWRRNVLTWLGGGAVIAGLTGLIIGWLRWRPGWGGRPTYSEGRKQPYRAFWLRWHFWSGLIGGTLALTWALSGYLTNNPWQIFSPANPSRTELSRYLGERQPERLLAWQPAPLATELGDIVELSWRRLGDSGVLVAVRRDGNRQSLGDVVPKIDEAALAAAARRLGKDAPIASLTLQNDYDSYYYPNHRQDTVDKPLPVLRIDLADAGATHLYIDPLDGRLLSRQDRSRRVYRWLFSALHHWDIGWLYYRPVWDLWMWLWIGLGLVLAASSVVIGWQRLGKTFRRRPQTAAARGPECEAELATTSRST
jgi:uncharacterized iron-regulated membrane protein